LSEDKREVRDSLDETRMTKTKYFFFGFLSGIVLFIAFIFIADVYLNQNEVSTSFENSDYLDGGDEDFEELDYPSWMDEFVDPPAGVEPQNVYTFTCELVSRKPDLFTTACADFGEAVFDVEWVMWSAEEARGTGTYSVNDCDPVCAEGTRHEVPVYVWLSDTSTDGKNFYLNTLRIVPKEVYEGKVDVVLSEYAHLYSDVVVEGRNLAGATWDLSRDWKSFPDFRSNLPN
jgi:hypothetical protein